MTLPNPTPTAGSSAPTPFPTHNAQRLLENLREHLARHDKPIALLLGAGASCAVQVPRSDDATRTEPLIPAVDGLTRLCGSAVANLGLKFRQSWTQISDQCVVAFSQAPTIEAILSRLHMMLGALGPSDTLTGLTLTELQELERVIRLTIAEVVTPAEERIPNALPHSHLARWLASTERKHPVEIFTVNYDVLIEHALEKEHVPIFDGFVGAYHPFFYSDSLRRAELAPGASWTRLWKMHGSVTWHRAQYNGRVRIVRGAPDPSGAMIFPSFLKYDESRQQPYSAFMERFTHFLNLDDALLIVSGFGFGDDHINELIFAALENRPRTHVYALQYTEHRDDDQLIKRSLQRRNIVVAGPETGIIAGQRARWTSGGAHQLLPEAFELTTPHAGATFSASSTPTDIGKMKIGDFAHFSKFLSSMAFGC